MFSDGKRQNGSAGRPQNHSAAFAYKTETKIKYYATNRIYWDCYLSFCFHGKRTGQSADHQIQCHPESG